MDPEVKPDQAKKENDAPADVGLNPMRSEEAKGDLSEGGAADFQAKNDQTEEDSAAPAEGGKNPVKCEDIKVVSYNWRKLKSLGLAIVAVILLLIGYALAPREKLSAQELAAQQESKNASNDQTPKVPLNVANAVDKYSDLRQPDVAGGHPQTAPRQDGANPSGGAGTQEVAQPTAVDTGDRGDQSPFGLKTHLGLKDQRRKDSLSATRAPVAFEAKGMKQPDPASPRDTGTTTADLGGLNRMVDRLAGGTAANPGEDDQNRQGEKKSFTKENRDDFPYLKTTLLTPLSKYEVKAGSIIPGVLLTGIYSDLPGQITAQVRENVYDTVSGRYLLIPQGTRLIGEYDSKISYGQERVLVVWTRIIMPNGNSIGLEGMPGVDLSGYAGVSGGVNNHYGKLITGVILGSVIGAGAQVATGGQGAPNVPPSFGQLAVSGAATNINQAGQQITQKNLNLQPTLEISPGQKINVFLTKDMILKPYTE
jgi:type IV secretion system protein TrbI